MAFRREGRPRTPAEGSREDRPDSRAGVRNRRAAGRNRPEAGQRHLPNLAANRPVEPHLEAPSRPEEHPLAEGPPAEDRPPEDPSPLAERPLAERPLADPSLRVVRLPGEPRLEEGPSLEVRHQAGRSHPAVPRDRTGRQRRPAHAPSAGWCSFERPLSLSDQSPNAYPTDGEMARPGLGNNP